MCLYLFSASNVLSLWYGLLGKLLCFQTKAGPVLVAINPFKKVPLYGNDYIEAYKRKSIESPHVYAITDTAIREMIRGNSAY